MSNKNGIPDDWKTHALSEVVDVRFSSVDKKSRLDESPVRLCNYMDVWKNNYIHDRMPFMKSTASALDIKRFKLQRDDVLLTKDSETKEEIAQPSVVRDDVVLGYHLALLRPNPTKVYGPFLAAQLNIPEFRRQFVRNSSGATRFGLGIDTVKQGTVWLPVVKEQRKISEILVKVDDAIEQTRAVINQARHLKTALLQDLLTHGLPGTHTDFKEVRGLGLMPASWRVASLEQMAKVERGKFTHRPRNDPNYYGGDIPFVQTGDVASAGDYLTTHSQTLNGLGLSVSRLFPTGTILFVIAGSVGEPSMASYEVACPDSIVGITPKPSNDALYLLRVLQQAQGRIVRTATESAQANISLELLRPLLLPCPDHTEQIQIGRLIRSVVVRIEQEQEKLIRLNSVQSALTQCLLTGRVRVKIGGTRD